MDEETNNIESQPALKESNPADLWPNENWTKQDWDNFFAEDEDDNRPPRFPRWMISILGLFLLVGFIMLSAPALSPLLFDNMDYLNQNIELSQEPMVEQARRSVVAITATGHKAGSRNGTGFAVTSDGWILTNHHVVNNAKVIKVTLDNGKEYYAAGYRQLKSYDIVLLKISAEGIPYLPVSQPLELEPGQQVTIVGNPLGFMRIAVRGPILAINRYHLADQGGMLKMAAEVRPGSSGSPIINEAGQAVGIIFGLQESTVGEKQINMALGLSLDLVMDDLNSQGIVK